MDPTLAAVQEGLVEHFGQQPTRASVSFVGVEPIEVLRFEPTPDTRAYVTLGMSRRPMTAAGDSVVTDDGPRAELLLLVRDPVDAHADVWRRLAVLAASPAVESVVYRPGMTLDLAQSLSAGSRCTGVVVEAGDVPDLTTPAGPVVVLRLLPATASELARCRVHGAAAVLDQWTAAHTDVLDLLRDPLPQL